MRKQLNLKVGFTCNNNCKFCYLTEDEKKLGDRAMEEIKNDLFLYREQGVTDVAFSGGEPTIRNDIFELVSHARHLGYEERGIVSNGRMFYYLDFCFKLVESGANSFVITLVGHIAEIHDYLVRVDGAFNQVIAGIKNLKKLNQRVIINSVITKQNYRFLPQFVDLLKNLGVNQIQLAFPLITGNAYENRYEIVPSKSEIIPYLYEALDLASKYGILIMVEAYPFCFLRGYERFHYKLYIPQGYVTLRNVAGKLTEPCGEPIKGPMCGKCKYDLVCDGPWKEYTDIFGWDEFKPVPGKKVNQNTNLLSRKTNW